MMSGFCTPALNSGLAAQLLADVDCRAFGLVERGYAALSAQGGPVSLAINGLLVIAVALFGYRLLLGRGLHLQDALALTVKIGIVLLLASSWSGWQPLAYDALARGPVRLATDLLAGIGARDPVNQLQDALDGLEAASLGYRTRAGIASPLVGGPAASAMTLHVAGLLLVQSLVGVMIVARIMLAILLATTPAMAGFVLFDATRGMVSGWLATLATAALVPLFVLVLASIEFSILLPMIARNLAEQAQGRFEPESVTPIGLISLIFAVAMLAAIFVSARIAGGIRIAGARIAPRLRIADHEPIAAPLIPRTDPMPPVFTVANALHRSVQREAAGGGAAHATSGVMQRPVPAPLAQARSNYFDASPRQAPGGGWSMQRIPRRSRAATKRDG